MPEPHEVHQLEDLQRVRHHPAEIIFGVAAFLIAILLAALLPRETSWIGGLHLLKQPAFWPFVSIAGMVIFGACELFWAWRRRKATDGAAIGAEVLDWMKAVEFAAWFLAYVWLVPVLGYLPASIAFCVALTVRLGYRGRRMHVAAVLTAIATVVVFKSLLDVKIPGGAIYEYLPAGIRNFMILYL